MKTKIVWILIVVLIIILGLYFAGAALFGLPEENTSPTSADNAPPGSIHNLPVPPAVTAVRTQAAQELNAPVGEVIILSVYEKEWSDSCLGLGGIAESCLQVISPGYEVTVQARGAQKVYRTNSDGTVVRAQQ